MLTDVGPQILGQALFDDLFDLLAEPNPRAAMPSLHFAAGFIVIVLGYLVGSRKLMLTASLYSTAMAFSLIYLGEHYFADILIGGAVAVAAAFIAETALGNGPGLGILGNLTHWSPGWRERLASIRRVKTRDVPGVR